MFFSKNYREIQAHTIIVCALYVIKHSKYEYIHVKIKDNNHI